MSNSIDDRPRPGSTASVTAGRALPEQTFFSDPIVDRLMGVTMTLAAEVYVLRSRLRMLERSQRRAGHPSATTDELSSEEAEAERHDAAAFAEHLLAPVIGEQQARGPV